MKKAILLFTICMCISFLAFSQSLEGEWSGSFFSYSVLEILQDRPSPIKLYFSPDGDSSYNVYSYSKGKDSRGKDTIIVCKVYFKRIAVDSIYLEETEVLKPKNITPACLQKMYLKITEKDNTQIMSGIWKNDTDCYIDGAIILKKKKYSK